MDDSIDYRRQVLGDLHLWLAQDGLDAQQCARGEDDLPLRRVEGVGAADGQVAEHGWQLQGAANHHAQHSSEQIKKRECKRAHACILARDGRIDKMQR